MKRFVQGLLCGIALFSVLILTGIPGLLPNVVTRLDRAERADWQQARVHFLADLAFQACATSDDVRAAAALRGWEVETQSPDPASGARFALIVHTRPPQPDVAGGDIALFDARGCLMR